jgi:hypothetical protein
VSPKMRVQTQFHHAPGCGVTAERIHQIHQRIGSFIVVKVLVHFVPELRQLFGLHKLQLYAVPLFMQILSKVQYKAFFNHIDRPMKMMAMLINMQRPPADIMGLVDQLEVPVIGQPMEPMPVRKKKKRRNRGIDGLHAA